MHYIEHLSDIQKDGKLRLTFCGGVGSVTGANFLLEGPLQVGEASKTNNVLKILVDCGMEQGGPLADASNRKPFIYDPKTADILLVTHAHMDHVGRIAKLVHDGFDGVIYSTPETMELATLMLEDALKLTTMEAMEKKLPALFGEADVKKSFAIWKAIPYHIPTVLSPGYEVYLKDAGHVLGSTMYELTYTAPAGVLDKKGQPYKRKVVFTGDLGNSPTPLLKDTEKIDDADYLLMESVYGDRNHEDRELRLEKLEQAIESNTARGGTLLIPSFSLEKTQELLFEIHRMMDEKKLPRTQVYLDSPLAIKLTEMYRRLNGQFNTGAEADIARGHDLFTFPGLQVVEDADASKAIKYAPAPKIIIAGSGMSNGGRIQHHELNYLSDSRTTLLLIGYQAVGTLGRQIQEGAKRITIYNKEVVVNATIEHIDGYSSHKDSDHLVEFVEPTAEKVRQVFVVMGETKSSLFLVQRLRDYLGVNAVHPNEGDTVVLE
ncbi:MAG: MBL fold metallo-hydrolase [Patescibacteria group bacterium]